MAPSCRRHGVRITDHPTIRPTGSCRGSWTRPWKVADGIVRSGRARRPPFSIAATATGGRFGYRRPGVSVRSTGRLAPVLALGSRVDAIAGLTTRRGGYRVRWSARRRLTPRSPDSTPYLGRQCPDVSPVRRGTVVVDRCCPSSEQSAPMSGRLAFVLISGPVAATPI